jgi:hypothetical protein
LAEKFTDRDISNVGIGGMLSQAQEGKECVQIMFKGERDYCVT